MGYYTTFTLYVHEDAEVGLGLVKPGDAEKALREFASKLKEGEECFFLHEIITDDEEYEAEGAIGCVHWKWYNHKSDMAKLSARFPNLIFRLEGEGEEEDDRWHQYYRAGKMQECRAKITIKYPEFDINKLDVVKDES